MIANRAMLDGRGDWSDWRIESWNKAVGAPNLVQSFIAVIPWPSFGCTV